MAQALSQSTSHQSAQIFAGTPHVNCSTFEKLFNDGAGFWKRLFQNAKNHGPHLLDSLRRMEIHRDGLFENVESDMRFKKGDAVWLYYTSEPGGYPGMYSRPGIITKRIHPTSFMVAFCGTHYDYRKGLPKEWPLEHRSHEHHPSELLTYSDVQSFEDNECNAKDRLDELRDRWKAEAPPERQAAWWKSEEEREERNREINRTLRPILARMMA